MSGILVSEAYFGLLQKMAAKIGFSVIGQRDFLRDPKKYTFGKLNFKTFYKTRIFEILPPFLSTLHSWIDSELDVFISADGGHVFELHLKGPRSAFTTNQTISILICNRIVDNLL